ncbi:hypothetical protein HQO26_06810 [Rhodococcus fascians]|nr:hypothetical protein [Rhodococcus fascians]MBY4417179.1 hypothetical protein [Rhodococcus fascians]
MLNDELDKVDAVAVLAAAAGLQLVHGNIHHLFRLERLASHAARHGGTSSQRLSATAVRRLLRTPEIGSQTIIWHEDEFEGFITVEVPYFGTTYLVLQGLLTDSAVIARNLLASVFGPTVQEFPIEFSRRVGWAAQLLLQTSAAFAENLGLGRYATAPRRDLKISVPGTSTIEQLAGFVTFNETALLSRFTSEAADYLRSALFADVDAMPSGDHELRVDDAIIATPFIRTSRGVVVAAPFELMATLRHLIGVESVNCSCGSTLTKAASAFAARVANNLFEVICDDRLEESENSSLHIRRFRGRFDTDKFLDLRIRVDSFDNYDPTTLYQEPVKQCGGSEVADVDGPCSRTLVVDVVWSHGAGAHSFTETNESLHLTGLYPEFETILYSPGAHQLTLWYFAQALDRATSSARMMMTSTEDAYAFYDSGSEQSFYASDEGPPTAIFIAPGDGEQLRRTVAERIGRTYVHSGRRTYEAVLVHGGATTVRRVIGPVCVYVAELPHARVWVESSSAALNAPVEELAEAACFWLYKLGMEFSDLLEAQPSDDTKVGIEVTGWDGQPGGSQDSWIEYQVCDTAGVLTLKVATPPMIESGDPPNTLDRLLVSALIKALTVSATKPTSADSVMMLNSLTPPGQCRMLHVADQNVDPVTWRGELPAPRRAVSAVVATLLDDLGSHLKERGRSVGPISDDQRTKVLNTEVVPYFGDRLAALLAEQDDSQLLRHLIRANEALLREGHVEQRTFASRVACFGRQSDIVERFSKSMTESANTAVSSRFLIEYVSGNPAVGASNVTTESYDMMVALASEVTNKGFLSDAIHAGISTATVSILPSGRFGIAREDDRWITSLHSFLLSHASTAVESIARKAQSEHRKVESQEEEFDLTPHDRVATIEFGFSYSDLIDFIGKLLDFSSAQGQCDVGKLTVAMIRDHFVVEFHWEIGKVDRILDALSMAPETDFWKLGAKVHPWRYNRDRSYLRRPLIRRITVEGDAVVFGHRNTFLAPMHWYGQYDSGRLKATTTEMKKALSEAINRKGVLFENQVETALAGVCDPVRRRVSKVGKYDLRNIDGLNLGDIDLVGYHTPSRTVLLIEAKSLQTSRTPSELRNEITNVLEGPHSAVARLNGRYQWALGHIDDVRNELEIPPGRITLKPMIVIDNDLVTRAFNSSPFPIVPLDQLVEVLDGLRTMRRSSKRARRR